MSKQMHSDSFSITFEGDWYEIVDYGEKMSKAIYKANISEELDDDRKEWENWRPKKEENIHRDMKEKSVEKSSIGDVNEEKPGGKPEEKVKDAKQNLKDTVNEEEKIDNSKKFFDNTFSFFLSHIYNFFNKIEKVIYKYIIGRFSAKHYETETFQSRIKRKTRIIKDEENYVLKVFFDDKDEKEKVLEELEKMEELDSQNI